MDGEVCGLGALADSVKAFMYWVPIKLKTNEALRLCVSCGDALVEEVSTHAYRRKGLLSELFSFTPQNSRTAWHISNMRKVFACASLKPLGILATFP